MLEVATHLLALTYTSTVIPSLTKQVLKPLSTSLSSAATSTRLVSKRVVASVSNTIVLSYAFALYRTLSASATSTVTVIKALTLFRVMVATPLTSAVSFVKAIKTSLTINSYSYVYITTKTARFVLLVTNVYTNVVSYVHRILPNVVDTLFVPTKKTLVTVAGFVSVLVRPKKTNIVASKQDDIYG